nr:hypothetical protein [Tanacetum cinerariifolium]
EETSTFYNSLPEFENFYFDLGEISIGSTTTHSDISLLDYEAFYFDDDHIKEISSGSTTTYSDISLSEYDSFIFEEFVYELAHIISPPEYDCFYFKDLPDQGELMSVLNSGVRENLLSTTLVNLPIEDDRSPLLIEDDNLREKLVNVHLLIANIEALKDNPTQSSELLTKSSSTSPKSFLEETNTFHNSLPEFEKFYIDLEEIKISSSSTTTHSDFSLSEYDSFIFDFTHEEFVDELAHIISPPKYDCFYFWDLPDPDELMSILNSEIRENLSTTSVNLPIEDDHSPLLAYVVWIFLAYLTYPVIPPYLHPFGNEDTIFDPVITINRVYSFKPGLSHRCGAFKKFKYSS